jgi:hypothetical protein
MGRVLKDIAHDELDRWLAFLDETTPEENIGGDSKNGYGTAHN